MSNPNLQKIIKLTQSQYNTLANGGTVGDFTGLNDNYLYLIQEDYEFPTTTTARKILMSTSTAGLVEWQSLTANDIPNLNASKINAGTFGIARIPTGTTASTVALGNHDHTAANIVSWLGLGTTRSASAMTWGTLTTANGYTILLATDQPNGGGLVIAEKDGKTYMQIDGDFYVNEGGTRLARVGEAQPASDVYAWAKAATKPSYTYSEVGAAAASHTHTKSQITDFPSSMPASDVYDWAKASTKPSYNFGEISAGDITIGSGNHYINLRSGHDSYNGGIYYSTPGNEAIVFANKNAVTSWIFATTNVTGMANWTTLTPSMQIKNGKVVINKLIADGTSASYNLDVNGTMNATTIYQNGSTLADTYLAKNAQAKDSAKLNGEEASYYLNYNNLSNKPTIPTVSNATITIKQTGISDQTFTLNGSATTITLADTNTWRPLGTGANDACAGNDSRLSDSRPASDVYAWAKAATKPSYTASEVGALASDAKVVLYSVQSLTNIQKATARLNIGAGTSDLEIGNTATTAAAGNHTHTLSITSGGSSPTTLAANTTYTLTAGGSTLVFKTPAAGGGSAYYANQYNQWYYFSNSQNPYISSQIGLTNIATYNYANLFFGFNSIPEDFATSLSNGHNIRTSSRSFIMDLAIGSGYMSQLVFGTVGYDITCIYARTIDAWGGYVGEPDEISKLGMLYLEAKSLYGTKVVNNSRYEFAIGRRRHCFIVNSGTTFRFYANLKNDNTASITTLAGLCAALYNAGFRSSTKFLIATGIYGSYTKPIVGIYATASSSGLTIMYMNGTTQTTTSVSSATVSDSDDGAIYEP